MRKTGEQQERAAEHVFAKRARQFLGKGRAARLGDGIDLLGRLTALLLGPAGD
ncbi:hypothetical protein D3C87_2192650 [compost metagenome]